MYPVQALRLGLFVGQDAWLSPLTLQRIWVEVVLVEDFLSQVGMRRPRYQISHISANNHMNPTSVNVLSLILPKPRVIEKMKLVTKLGNLIFVVMDITELEWQHRHIYYSRRFLLESVAVYWPATE